jgi:hypothetical protein
MTRKIALLSTLAGLALLAAGCGASVEAKHAQHRSNANDLRSPAFVARVTGAVLHGPNRPGTVVTVTFTVEEQGEPPGTGVPAGSAFLVLLTHTNQLTPAYGEHGRYRANARLGPGGITGIQIGGFMPSSGPRVENGGFWLPTFVDVAE